MELVLNRAVWRLVQAALSARGFGVQTMAPIGIFLQNIWVLALKVHINSLQDPACKVLASFKSLQFLVVIVFGGRNPHGEPTGYPMCTGTAAFGIYTDLDPEALRHPSAYPSGFRESAAPKAGEHRIHHEHCLFISGAGRAYG